jgi:DNA-binding MarR family transcriptional regulator
MDGPLLSTLVRRLHLLFRQRIHADLVAAGHSRLTPAHMYIFQLPGPDGVRPTELARRTNMTKQAMNHLLAGLERDSYLRREAASDDGRGTVIRLTDLGRDVQRVMQDSSRRIEDEWATDLADGTIEQLRDILARLDTAVGAPP